DAPFARLLADDQRPLVLVRYGKDGVASRRHVFAANRQVRIRHQRGRVIGPSAPYLPIRHKSTINLARLVGFGIMGARARIIYLNGLAIGELALCLCRWAR